MPEPSTRSRRQRPIMAAAFALAAVLHDRFNRRVISTVIAAVVVAFGVGRGVPCAMLRAADDARPDDKADASAAEATNVVPRDPAAMATEDKPLHAAESEDVKAWTTSRAGKWTMSGGVTLEVTQHVYHGADVNSTAILTWPTDKSGGTARHSIALANDFFGNREPWLLAWVRDETVLWALTGSTQSPQEFRRAKPTPTSLRRIDFSDPTDITHSSWTYAPDLVPDAIRAEIERAFRSPATTSSVPANARSHNVHSARAEDARPVTELLNGAWKNRQGDKQVSITFPEKATDAVKWTADVGRKPEVAIIHENLARKSSPYENAVVFARPDGANTYIRLRRGIGDTLLLDTFPTFDPTEVRQVNVFDVELAHGIVLERVPASADP